MGFWYLKWNILLTGFKVCLFKVWLRSGPVCLHQKDITSSGSTLEAEIEGNCSFHKLLWGGGRKQQSHFLTSKRSPLGIEMGKLGLLLSLSWSIWPTKFPPFLAYSMKCSQNPATMNQYFSVSPRVCFALCVPSIDTSHLVLHESSYFLPYQNSVFLDPAESLAEPSRVLSTHQTFHN